MFLFDNNKESRIPKSYFKVIHYKRKVNVNENNRTRDSIDALTTINWGQTHVPKYL